MTQLKALERSTVYVTYTSLRVLGMDCGRMYRGATRLQPRQSVGPAGGQMLRYPLARETDIVAHLTRFCLLSLSLSLCVSVCRKECTHARARTMAGVCGNCVPLPLRSGATCHSPSRTASERIQAMAPQLRIPPPFGLPSSLARLWPIPPFRHWRV